jgi:hypothetical protein
VSVCRGILTEAGSSWGKNIITPKNNDNFYTHVTSIDMTYFKRLTLSNI